MPENNTQSDKERSDYFIKRAFEERLQVMRSRFELDQSFDKYLLTFSTGTLYLSLYFFHDFIKSSECIIVLILGWTALVASMFSALASIYFSRKSYEDLENHLNNEVSEEMNARDQGNYSRESKSSQEGNGYFVDLFERLSVWMFAVGVVLIMSFYVYNTIIN